jgi:hypothetical protein
MPQNIIVLVKDPNKAAGLLGLANTLEYNLERRANHYSTIDTSAKLALLSGTYQPPKSEKYAISQDEADTSSEDSSNDVAGSKLTEILILADFYDNNNIGGQKVVDVAKALSLASLGGTSHEGLKIYLNTTNVRLVAALSKELNKINPKIELYKLSNQADDTDMLRAENYVQYKPYTPIFSNASSWFSRQPAKVSKAPSKPLASVSNSSNTQEYFQMVANKKLAYDELSKQERETLGEQSQMLLSAITELMSAEESNEEIQKECRLFISSYQLNLLQIGQSQARIFLEMLDDNLAPFAGTVAKVAEVRGLITAAKTELNSRVGDYIDLRHKALEQINTWKDQVKTNCGPGSTLLVELRDYLLGKRSFQDVKKQYDILLYSNDNKVSGFLEKSLPGTTITTKQLYQILTAQPKKDLEEGSTLKMG